MSESTPKFDDSRRVTVNRPLFARDVNPIADDLADARINDRATEHDPHHAPFSRHALIKLGTPHAAIAGVTEGCDEVDLLPDWDTASTADALWGDKKDDQLYRDPIVRDATVVDVAELLDADLATHVGDNTNSRNLTDTDSQREVYAIQSPTRAFIITGSSVAPSGYTLYGGRQARLANDPAGTASPWEVHPDATADVALFSLAELTGGGPSGAAVGTVVFANRRSFPKQGDRAAGIAWLFVDGGSLPTGQYMGQWFGNVAQNQTGFSFFFATSMLDL